MTPYKAFKPYSSCAFSKQTLINYIDIKLLDNQLVKYVKYGMLEELKETVQLWDLSDKHPDFVYHVFEHRCEKIYTLMVASKQILKKSCGNPTLLSNPTNCTQSPLLLEEEFICKTHSYLESLGKCHYCKGYCGSAHRECEGPFVKGQVLFPPDYVAPPKPAN